MSLLTPLAHDLNVTEGVAGQAVTASATVAVLTSLFLAPLGTCSASLPVDVFIPGYGSIGGADQVRARIEQDRACVHTLPDTGVAGDPRVGPSATFGKDWLPGVHKQQLQHLARRMERDGTPG